VGSVQVTTTKTTTQRFSRQFTPSNQSIPYRLVGSYEYAKCLDNFEALVKSSTPEQIEVYNKILADRPEFAFFNGVSSVFAVAPNLRAADQLDRRKFNDQFLKDGIAWMMALARVELGATASMYGKAEHPFEVVVQSNFGAQEYLEVLIDDVTAHLKSLANEASFKRVLKLGHKVDNWTLAYLRRLKMVKDMLITISRQANPEAIASLKPVYDDVEDYETKLVSLVQAWLVNIQSTNTTTSTRTRQVSSRLTSEIELCERYIEDSKKPANSSRPTVTPADSHGSHKHGVIR